MGNILNINYKIIKKTTIQTKKIILKIKFNYIKLLKKYI